ncbi:uncharacterized protein LOC9654915 [Selaginella moellendorffii]|nr:uncharacterized protein LOC9654915 [Selaginella moellendorffii]|eukprot:XP_002983520.2 uncharacterized protein LOC9654915 [Selaginella moellendorffii]
MFGLTAGHFGSCFNESPLRHMNSTMNGIILISLGAFLLLALHLCTPLSYYSDLLFEFKDRVPSMSSPNSNKRSSFNESTSIFFKRFSEYGKQECHNVSTTAALFFGLPRAENGGEITLSTDVLHKIWIVSYAASGNRRCFGGDFYETDLSSPQWKSRPPITDVGDGSYLVELKVDEEFAGNYTFKVILLYSNFRGLEHQPDPWALTKEMLTVQIRFTTSRKRNPHLATCTSHDFMSATTWSGKWTRTKFNESCQLDKEGRYRCLGEHEECDDSQCIGNLESLESNGWVYSAHCKFRIWNAADAWKCLDGKKLFFWGDSNHQDTIRNLMNFVLGLNQEYIERIFVANVTNPSNPAQNFSLVSIFNGHADPNQNLMGLGSLYVPAYRDLVKNEFFRGRAPDAVIINSGIHDGHAWKKVHHFAAAVQTASAFWRSLLENKSSTRVVIRNTITLAAIKRSDPSNPQKIEVFNSILSNEFQKQLHSLENQLMFVDDYDMTFPWHYDFCCSDGGHYGIKPALAPWFDRVGHFYFVDVMLAHVLLTAICS